MQTLQVYTVEVFEEKEDSDTYNKKFKSIFIIFLLHSYYIIACQNKNNA